MSFRIAWTEQRRQAGVASLLARMLGSDSVVRTPELLQRDVDGFGSLGIQYDGSTLTTWTICPPKEAALAESAQTLLLNVVAQPRFSDEICERARAEQQLASYGITPLPSRGAIVSNALIDRLRDAEGV